MKNLKLRKAFIGFIFVLLPIVFSSCSSIIGYSVVLWNIPEYEIPDGTIVPVYLKSNISQVYVIELDETGEKIEVPLWKLSEPQKKSSAKKLAKEYSEYNQKYAKCILDGLPIRQDKVNTSKQVYRLRKNEIIRVLSRGNGVVPTNGKSDLKGEWLRVLTNNGVFGWCFSYNLRLFTMNPDGSYGEGAIEANVKDVDNLIEEVLKTKWYPDYYSQMINSSNIDLNVFKPDFGFDTGFTSGTVSVKIPVLNVSYPYAGYTKVDDKVYKFNNTSLQITVRNSKSISVQYTDEKGMPKSYVFVKLNDDLSVTDLIVKEITKREDLIKAIIKLGPDFRSSNYGTISFQGSNEFTWNGNSKLIPNIIPRNASHSGKVSVKYFVPSKMKAEWDGILTFNFDSSQGSLEEINFFYKKEANGLRLTLANVQNSFNELKGRTTYTVSSVSNSLIMFFQK